MPLEYEHKFLVTDQKVFEQLNLPLSRVGDFSFDGREKDPHFDLYLDSGNYSLHKSGSGARIRKSKRGLEFNLKLRQSRYGREELTESITQEELREIFNDHRVLSRFDFYEEIYRAVGGARLLPFAMADCDRTVIRYSCARKRIIFALDSVTFMILNGSTKEVVRLPAEYELEIEKGSNASLRNVDEIANILKQKWPSALQPSESKFARALEKAKGREALKPDQQTKILLDAFQEARVGVGVS